MWWHAVTVTIALVIAEIMPTLYPSCVTHEPVNIIQTFYIKGNLSREFCLFSHLFPRHYSSLGKRGWNRTWDSFQDTILPWGRGGEIEPEIVSKADFLWSHFRVAILEKQARLKRQTHEECDRCTMYIFSEIKIIELIRMTKEDLKRLYKIE